MTKINTRQLPASTTESQHNETSRSNRSCSFHSQRLAPSSTILCILQVACAGLGFEIGEIWWTANEHGSSTVAAIEDTNNNGALVVPGANQQKKLRFVQLYTSKSYAARRSMLVTPPEDDDDENDPSSMHHPNNNNGNTNHHHNHNHHHDHECTKEDLEKHKLSPRLVDAISQTAQVVWANTLKREGLTGRSDIPLHTAVGMPVALDADGNMCVVVMFSPNNIQSTDEAMEYLQLISRSATSSSIPCLMPAFEKTENIRHVPTSSKRINAIRGHLMGPTPPQETSLGEGVTARFVSIDDDDDDGGGGNANNNGRRRNSTPEQIVGHDLASAPKDCFGIPMLPSFAELSSDATAAPAPAQQQQQQPQLLSPLPQTTTTTTANVLASVDPRASPAFEDVFDEASYGVWSTIMQQERPPVLPTPAPSSLSTIVHHNVDPMDVAEENGLPVGLNEGIGIINPAEDDYDDDTTDPKSLITTNKRSLDRKRKERLEEFCSAFLGMSVFDIADVWIPAGPEHPHCMSHVLSITSSNQSNAISEFKRVSGYTLVKFWSGAVGRAYSSGNPVWSCNPDVYIDKGRSHVFERANIMTAFAVPIVSGKKVTPVGVVCCYSMIQSGSVPFVLRFVQQALHLLWSGLDKVEPHKSVGQEMWQDVGPADLGEMAADVEMQHHFMSKKRPYQSISEPPQHQHQLQQTQQFAPQPPAAPDHSAPLSAQFRNINFVREEPAPSFSTVPPQQPEEAAMIPEIYNFQHLQHRQHEKPPEQRVSVQAIQAFHNHIKDAVRQVGEALPFSHTHVATKPDGSKRAHVAPTHHQLYHHQQQPQPQHLPQPQPVVTHLPPPKPAQPLQPAPLAMPHALPTRVVKAVDYRYPAGVPPPAPVPAPPMQVPVSPAPTAVAPSPVPVAPVQTYAPAAIQAPQPSPAPTQTFNQHSGQPLTVQPAPAHSPAPSQLSQNLLSQGMLQSIANQQYQFASHEQPLTPTQTPTAPTATTAPTTTQNHTLQYATPIVPTSVGVAAPPAGATAIPAQQVPLQSSAAYCMPITTPAYPAPDATRSSAPVSTTTAAGTKVKPCRIQGCDDPAVIRRPYCARHSGNRLCEHEGCTKCAQGSTRFCIAHGGGRRCTFPGCDKGARDKFFCAAHGGGKRCKAEGCNKSAVGGSSLCTAHGGGRRCAVEGCDKSAQSSTKFCVKHGGGKKCSHEGCEKVARGRTQFCAAHGGGVRCKLEGCNRVAIGKMQLCRAHGGGSRARAKNSAAKAQAAPAQPPPPPPMQSTLAPTAIYGGTTPQPLPTVPMPTLTSLDYPTPTSV